MLPLHPVVTLVQKPAPSAAIVTRIESVLAAPELKHGTVGVLVRSLDSGKTIYAKNPDTSLLPASNMKLVTASAALGLLGPTFRYTTRVLASGDDLVLQGSGDPSLDMARLQTLATAVKAAGVSAVKGRILYDATRFDSQWLGDGWQWDDEPFYYSAQVAGLCCDENVVLVSVKPGSAVGEPATVTLGSDYVAVKSSVTTTEGSTSAVSFDRTRGKNEVVVSGTIGRAASPKSEALTVEDPARFAAHRFAEALRTAGVTVASDVPLESATVPTAATHIASTDSAPLSELLKAFLKPSDNLYGECLLKTIGAEKGGAGTVAAAKKVIVPWFQARGIALDGVAEADGSGLSRMDLVTARFLVALLADRAGDTLFRDGLPIGGVDGTLKNRFKNTLAQGNVRAKTGTLTGASSLSGYLTTKAGERLAFSILMNNYDRAGGSAKARAAQDAIVLALLDLPK